MNTTRAVILLVLMGKMRAHGATSPYGSGSKQLKLTNSRATVKQHILFFIIHTFLHVNWFNVIAKVVPQAYA